MKATFLGLRFSGFKDSIVRINLDLTPKDIEAYKRAESSKLSPEVCDLLDAIIEEVENANI